MFDTNKICLCLAIALAAGGAAADSLYQETSFQPLVADRKAHGVGDLITVMVYENASATTTANTNGQRSADVGLDIDAFGRSRSGALRTNNRATGSGETRREGRVLAQLTVSVRAVAANGDLTIGGEQFLEVNNERQHIKVEGRVRALDVSEVNTVLSTRIADAKISYLGDGDVSDRQRPAWWQRFLTMFGL